MDPLLTIGARIRYARQAARFAKAVDFAKSVDVTRSQLSGYENDAHVPRHETLLRISSVTGRSLRWLLTGEESASEGATS